MIHFKMLLLLLINLVLNVCLLDAQTHGSSSSTSNFLWQNVDRGNTHLPQHTFFYMNARSLANKDRAMDTLLHGSHRRYDFLFFTETWFNDGLKIHKNWSDYYDVIRSDRLDGRGGGVAIFMSRFVAYEKVPHRRHDLYDLLAVDLQQDGQKHRIVLVYKPPSTASLDDLTPLLNKLKKLVDVPHPCTLIGDFNFPKINWAAHQAAQPAGLSAGEKAFMTFCAQNGLRQIITFATRLDKQLDILLTNSMGSFPHNCQKLNSQIVGIKTDHEPFECRFHFGFIDVPKIVAPPSASRGSGEKKNAGKRNRSQIQIGMKQRRVGKEIKKKIVRKSSSKNKDDTKSSQKKVANKTKGKAKKQQSRHHRKMLNILLFN